MHTPTILFGITQQAAGLSPWVWILIVLVIIILALWWLGRQDRGERAEDLSKPELQKKDELPAVETPKPEISMVERTVLDVLPPTETPVMQMPAPPEMIVRSGEEIVISEEAVEEITGETTEVKPVEYAPVGAPPITPSESETGSLSDLHEPPANFKLDDLEMIEGIGPKIAAVLRDAGINTFPELAAADPSALRDVLRSAGLRLADPTTWPEQARLAAEGKWDEFETLVSGLRGGRRVA